MAVHPGALFDLEPRDPGGAPCAHLLVQLLAEPPVFDRALALLSREPTRCYGSLP